MNNLMHFNYCVVLKIELFFLIPIQSCFVPASHLVEDIKNNSCVMMTIYV